MERLEDRKTRKKTSGTKVLLGSLGKNQQNWQTCSRIDQEKEMIQITRIRNESVDITTELTNKKKDYKGTLWIILCQ